MLIGSVYAQNVLHYTVRQNDTIKSSPFKTATFNGCKNIGFTVICDSASDCSLVFYTTFRPHVCSLSIWFADTYLEAFGSQRGIYLLKWSLWCPVAQSHRPGRRPIPVCSAGSQADMIDTVMPKLISQKCPPWRYMWRCNYAVGFHVTSTLRVCCVTIKCIVQTNWYLVYSS